MIHAVKKITPEGCSKLAGSSFILDAGIGGAVRKGISEEVTFEQRRE